MGCDGRRKGWLYWLNYLVYYREFTKHNFQLTFNNEWTLGVIKVYLFSGNLFNFYSFNVSFKSNNFFFGFSTYFYVYRPSLVDIEKPVTLCEGGGVRVVSAYGVNS